MTDFEIALSTLTALRDEAWSEHQSQMSIYREYRIHGALVNANLARATFDTLSNALEAIDAAIADAEPEPEFPDDYRTDAEADAEVFASIGWGIDEDYGSYGDSDY